MSETFTEVRAIIVDLLGRDESEVTMDARFREDLGVDSIDTVQLIMAAEDKYFVAEMPNEDAMALATVGEAVAYIDSHRDK